MAEWSIAAVLKTVELRGSRGSNPCLSAESLRQEATQLRQVLQYQMVVGLFLLISVCRKSHQKAKKRHVFVTKS